jgi:ATP-dependent DNA ligase
MPYLKSKASFIEPMLCLAATSLPEAPEWQYELKLDGYRTLAFKTRGKVELRSRNNKDFASRYPSIAEAFREIPDDTVVDGELVAFDPSGRPSFNALQNYGSSTVPLFYYAFDLLMLSGRDLRSEPLGKRRELLRTKLLPLLNEPIRYSPTLEAPLRLKTSRFLITLSMSSSRTASSIFPPTRIEYSMKHSES